MEMIYIPKRLKFSIAIATAFWILVQVVSAAEPMRKKDFEKTVHESYSISQDGEVKLANKHGVLYIETWDKPEVDIWVKIQVKAKSESKANEVFDRINIKFDNRSDYVEAITELEAVKGSWWNWGNNNSGDFSINYHVRMPVGCKLFGSNKYGNVILDKLDNDCNLEVKYGNMSIGDIRGDFNFTLGYGNGGVTMAENISGNLKYGKLDIGVAHDVEINTKYSKISIEQANDVKAFSKYDHYKIGKINSISNVGKYDNFDIAEIRDCNIETKYTDVKIARLEDQATFEMSYGGVKINEVGSSLSRIDATGKYTTFRVNVDNLKSAYFNLTAEHGGISLPSNVKVGITETKDSKSGYYGSKKAEAKLRMATKYGSIKLYN